MNVAWIVVRPRPDHGMNGQNRSFVMCAYMKHLCNESFRCPTQISSSKMILGCARLVALNLFVIFFFQSPPEYGTRRYRGMMHEFMYMMITCVHMHMEGFFIIALRETLLDQQEGGSFSIFFLIFKDYPSKNSLRA